ncbi:MAG TPA: CPBP family intramembrane glutamic endopeptidase [Acidimicrobiales bacterium]|nr:CPBP family intramembrane glutamic endopeptidase [Acidimicrobiales bacterium]
MDPIGLDSSRDQAPGDEAARARCPHCDAQLDTGLDWCSLCLKPVGPGATRRAVFRPAVPAHPGGPGPLHMEVLSTPRPGDGRKGVTIAVFVILLNVVIQGLVLSWAGGGRVASDTAITVAIWAGLVFYGIVAVVALKGLSESTISPVWTRGNPRHALLIGASVGAVLSTILVTAQRLAVGHLIGDPVARLIVSDGTPVRVIEAILVMVVAAPVVEEIVFRGILLESLRHRGERLALVVSSVLFAVAHLNPAELVYYTAMGAVLGRRYQRRGLRCSMAAHAAFNGALVVVALLTTLGPAHAYNVEGASFRLPSVWHHVGGYPTGSFAGPGGSGLNVRTEALPPGQVFNPGRAVAQAESGQAPLPVGMTITSAQLATYPAGEGVLMQVTVANQSGEVFLISDGGELWILSLAGEGSPRAEGDFTAMLQSLRLPAGASPSST